MAKRTAQRVWIRVLSKDDAAELSRLLTDRKSEWVEWECKLRGDNILVYVPITPWNPKTHKPDPSKRYMEKPWRVVPVPGGLFRLEYKRHTGQWWPVCDSVGELIKIAGYIVEQAECLGYSA